MTLFLLQHIHPEDGIEDVKTLGVYSSAGNAERAKERYLRLPGFRDWPDGFCIASYDIDQDEWTDGFGETLELDQAQILNFDALTVCRRSTLIPRAET